MQEALQWQQSLWLLKRCSHKQREVQNFIKNCLILLKLVNTNNTTQMEAIGAAFYCYYAPIEGATDI